MKITSTHSDGTELTLLRELDAATPAALDDAAHRRAEARLQQILAESDTAVTSHPAPRRSRALRRGVALAAGAAAVAVAVFAVGTGGSNTAYASWTAVPDRISAPDRAVADTACRGADVGLRSPVLALAERRGDWVVLLYTGTHAEFAGTPAATACMARLALGADSASDVDLGTAGGQGAIPLAGQFTEGSLFEFSAGGGMFGRADRPSVAVTLGDVGPDVAAVTVHPADGSSVEATVADGHYVAWWPDRALESDAITPDAAPSPGYDITLTTGHTLLDALPTLPR